MRVAVVGIGHVGLVTCVTMAELGHDVVGTDQDEAKLEAVHAGRAPFAEPGLEELLRRNAEAGRLRFVRDAGEAARDAHVVFICVGTPPRASGEANLLAVETAAREISRHATSGLVIAQKSTVPAGSADRLHAALVLERPDLAPAIDVVSNPEFLREGRAVEDSLHPDRLLVGASSARAFATMRQVYQPLIEAGVPLIETDVRSAELAKHASNAFLAMKISFANALARIAEKTGADVESVTGIMGVDPRIGPDFLQAGIGYGGYCFPKDLVAFDHLASSVGYDFPLLREVARINEEAARAAVEQVRDALWNLEGKRIALLGLSFKPDTDDVRFSPALAVGSMLIDAGADVVGYDPAAGVEAARQLPALRIAESAYEATRDAHCIVLCTEWQEFRQLDPEKLGELVRHRVVVDGRNFLDAEALVAAGFVYRAMGRPSRGAV
jgi:UDPglucose 6-dehydrogenase